MVDEVTGLANRGLIRRELDRELARAKRHNGVVAVHAIRVKGYRDYIDREGKAAAENLMCAIATNLEQNIRAMDILGALSEDTLLAILPDCQAQDSPADRLAGIATAVAEVDEAKKKLESLDISVITAAYPDSGETTDDLIRQIKSQQLQ